MLTQKPGMAALCLALVVSGLTSGCGGGGSGSSGGSGTPQAAAPVFSPAAGAISANATVAWSSSTPNANLYYCTGASCTPATAGTSMVVTSAVTICAQAKAAGYADSAVACAAYTVTARAATPSFSPPAGTYASAPSVAITCSTPASTIYYTTDGTTPTHLSARYTSPISVTATETVAAICSAATYDDTLAAALYTINPGGMYALPAIRTTQWQPGVTYNGGIPVNRNQCGTTVSPSSDATGATDTRNIQQAINACAAGQYVLLGPGLFHVAVPQNSNGSIYLTKSNVTLRGSGAGVTVLNQVGANAATYSVIVAGAQWAGWPTGAGCGGQSNCTDTAVASVPATNGLMPLSSDTVKESNTAVIDTAVLSAQSPALQVGELVDLTEQFDANFVWYSPDINGVGQCAMNTSAGSSGYGYCGWGEDWADTTLGADQYKVSRPIGQVNVITGISTNGATTTLTFAAPWHHAFRVAQAADLARISAGGTLGLQPVTGVGIENLTVGNGGGGDGGGNIALWAMTNSWVKNVESYNAGGGAVHFSNCFRCELRDSYLHTAGNPNPGGGGYGMEIDTYTSDSLFENNIVWSFNKVMVMRSAGGGNVVGYNYFEDGYGQGGYVYFYLTGTDPQGNVPYKSVTSVIVEVGMNASHMAGTQYVLFEGNQSFNIGSDSGWGNSTYITFFRNHATTIRRNVNNGTGTDNNSASCSDFACFGPVDQLSDWMDRRGIEVSAHNWWYSFVGNVIGYPSNYLQSPAIGYRYPTALSAQPESSNWVFEWNGIHNGGSSCNQLPDTSWIATVWELGTSRSTTPDAPSTNPGAGQQTVLNTLIRDGNYDYVTNSTRWMGTANICNQPGDSNCTATNTGNICTTGTNSSDCGTQYKALPAVTALPNSLYIPTSMQPPAFFAHYLSASSKWPWVDGSNPNNPLPGALPARQRFDDGTPNAVP